MESSSSVTTAESAAATTVKEVYLASSRLLIVNLTIYRLGQEVRNEDKEKILNMFRSILLKGRIDQTLTYPVGLIAKINEGEWQIALSTISFIYEKEDKQNPKPIPREILAVTTNYIMAEDINERSEVILASEVLSLVQYGGPHNSKRSIGFRNQNFFLINNPQQELRVDLKTVDTNQRTEGAAVFLLLLLRRIR